MKPYLSKVGRRQVRGFSLIEALVALLVVSFGMLAIVGFQANLAGASDVAKQRMEALRLAQEKMEQFRAFNNVAGFNAIASGSDGPFVSNANFTRTWTVSSGPDDTERWVNVVVNWSDRRGSAQEVRLQSAVAKFDPKDIGTLATGPGGTTVRKPKNRNINIPYPAVTLSGGTQSAFVPPPGNTIYVFDNVTGNIVKSCTAPAIPISAMSGLALSATVTAVHPYSAGNRVTIAGSDIAQFNGTFTVATPIVPGVSFTIALPSALAGSTTATVPGTVTLVYELAEGLDLATSGLTCTDFASSPRYLLSGYVRFDSANSPSGEEPDANQGSNARYDTRPLASTPLSFDFSNGSGGTPTFQCFAQRQRVVRTTATAVTVQSVSRSAGSSTVTVNASGHGFVNGQTVAINATSNPAFIGAFKIFNVGAGTFQYTLPPPLPEDTITSATGGTAALLQRIIVADDGTLPAGYSSFEQRFISYACIIDPVDHDSNAATARRWSGSVTINPDTSSWTIGLTSSTYRVCRYSADYNTSGTISNSEHPLWYRGVTGALDNQNYLVITGNQSCPTDAPADPLTNPPNYSDATTAVHQGGTAELSFQCGVSNCTGQKVVLEPSTTSADITME